MDRSGEVCGCRLASMRPRDGPDEHSESHNPRFPFDVHIAVHRGQTQLLLPRVTESCRCIVQDGCATNRRPTRFNSRTPGRQTHWTQPARRWSIRCVCEARRRGYTGVSVPARSGSHTPGQRRGKRKACGGETKRRETQASTPVVGRRAPGVTQVCCRCKDMTKRTQRWNGCGMDLGRATELSWGDSTRSDWPRGRLWHK